MSSSLLVLVNPLPNQVLMHHLETEVDDLRTLVKEGHKLILMDTNTNTDLDNYDHQLSPAVLLKLFLEGTRTPHAARSHSPSPNRQMARAVVIGEAFL